MNEFKCSYSFREMQTLLCLYIVVFLKSEKKIARHFEAAKFITEW